MSQRVFVRNLGGTPVVLDVAEAADIAGASLPDGDYGDVVISGSGTVWTIDSGVVSYAKMQDVSAASRLLGRGDSGAGDPQEITLGSNLVMSGTTLNTTSSVSVKYLKDFGVVADGVTNDTTAFNSAITYANANPNTTFIVPVGTTLVTTLSSILANEIYFVGEGAAGTCWIKSVTAGNVFTWGAVGTQPDGGGLINVGLIGSGAATQVMLLVANAARLEFENLRCAEIGSLATLGTTTTNAQGVSFKALAGYFANIANAAISIVQGSGLFIEGAEIFNNAGVVGSITAGRYFIFAGTETWDTILIDNSIIELFYTPIYVQPPSGFVVNNVTISDSIMDGCSFGPYFTADAGGSIATIIIADNEFSCGGTGTLASGIEFQGAGTIFDIDVRGNTIRQCAKHGVAIGATGTIVRISHNDIYGVNQAVGAFDGIAITAGASYLSIAGNTIGYDATAVGVTGQPQTGLRVGNCTHVAIVGNDATGTSANYNIGTLTNYKIKGNVGLADAPVLTEAEGGTGQTSVSAALDADLVSWAGVTRAAGFDAFAATPTSANLDTLVTDDTGSGALVFANTPTLVTPILGTPTSGTLTSCTGLPLTTGVTGTLGVANGGTGQTTEAEAIGELIQALSQDTTPVHTTDYIATYDDSADTGKKVLLSTLIGVPTAWTPALQFGGASTGITYTTQSGTYIQIGKLVVAYFVLDLTSKGSATGRASIAGLPSTPSVPGGGSITVAASLNTVVAPTCLAYTDGIIYLEQLNITGSPGSQVDWDDTDFINTSLIIGNVNYVIA